MKRWVHSTTNVDRDILQQAIDFTSKKKGSEIDLANHIIIVPFDKGVTEDVAMGEGMLGKWFVDNGFDVEFRTGDVEYTTQDGWMNYRGWTREKGHKANLRDRLIMKVTW